jgi:hypothetical protein
MSKLPVTLDLGKLLEDNRNTGGTKIIIKGGMRAPVVDGEVTLEACWVAEIYIRANMRVPLIQIVDTEVAGLFAQMAMLAGAGEVKVTRDDDDGPR